MVKVVDVILWIIAAIVAGEATQARGSSSFLGGKSSHAGDFVIVRRRQVVEVQGARHRGSKADCRKAAGASSRLGGRSSHPGHVLIVPRRLLDEPLELVYVSRGCDYARPQARARTR